MYSVRFIPGMRFTPAHNEHFIPLITANLVQLFIKHYNKSGFYFILHNIVLKMLFIAMKTITINFIESKIKQKHVMRQCKDS